MSSRSASGVLPRHRPGSTNVSRRARGQAGRRTRSSFLGLGLGRSVLAGAVLAGAVLGGGLLAGCQGDPSQPQTWIKKLDGAQRGEAVQKLAKLYEQAGGNGASPGSSGPSDEPDKAKAIRMAAVPALVQAYQKDEKRLEILQALRTFRDPQSAKVLHQALDFIPGVTETNARIAAELCGEFKDKECVDPLIKGLGRVGGSGPDAVTSRRTFIDALGKIGDKRAVAPLLEIASQNLTRDNAKVVAAAAIALGELRDPAGVKPLIRLLFGIRPIDSIARVALTKIGPSAIAELAAVYKGEDREIVEWAKQFPALEPGNIPMAAAVPLGHIGDKSAVPILLSRLEEKGDTGNRIRVNASTSLAILGDRQAVGPLIKVLELSGYADDQVPVAQALAMLGDKAAVAPLLKAAQSGLLKNATGDLVHFFRWNAGLALARLVDDEDAPQYQALVEREKDPTTKNYFLEYQPRVTAAIECKKDVDCWVKKLKDSDWRVQEKAAYMLARLGDKKALEPLLAQLGNRHEEARRGILLALDRLADKSCTSCIAKLEAQIKSDRTDSKFKDSIVYDEATLLERIRRR